MNIVKTERETFETCLANLRALKAVKNINLKQGKADLPSGVDAKLILRADGKELCYLVEVKRTVTRVGLDHLVQQLERYTRGTKAKPLLLTECVSPQLAERLIEAGVNFADAAGNTYLDWPGKLHIQIQGKKLTRIAEARSQRLTQPSGLRILYALLTEPPEKWGTYRDITKASGVALGSVAVVMRELRTKGYLVQKARDEWRLTQKRKLLDLWVEGYGARLRPDLLIGRYQPSEPQLEQTLERLQRELAEREIGWSLTGGFAADILTRHFLGEQLSFFATEWPLDLTRRLKWLPSEHGPVTVLRKFSPLVTFNLKVSASRPVSHPLLVYAELIFQGREREVETAKIIYDRYLSSLIAENGP